MVRSSQSVSWEQLESRQLFSGTVPSAADQYMLELINRARANPVAEAALQGVALNSGLLPNTISTDAKQPLVFTQSMLDAASSQSQHILDIGLLTHSGTNGSSLLDRLGAVGLSLLNLLNAGENIASTALPANATSQQVQDAVDSLHSKLFVDSGVFGKGDRLNILNANVGQVGVSTLNGAVSLTNSLVTTLDVAGLDGKPFLTGVAFTDAVDPDNFYSIGEGLEGLTVTATRISDGVTATTQTLPTGGYSLALDPGTYTVTLTGGQLLGPVNVPNVTIGSKNVKLDWVPPLLNPLPIPTPNPTPEPTPTPTPTPEPTPDPTQVGTIRGSIFQDLNKDGKRQANEPVMQGLRVYLDLDSDGALDLEEPNVVTDATGSYAFNNLAPGHYTIRIETGLRWKISGGVTSASNAFSTELDAGEVEDVKGIGVSAVDSANGFVFSDLDGNGVRGPKEKGLKGRRVFADLNSDGVWQTSEPSSLTNKLGGWALSGIPDGDFTIRILPKAKFASTTSGGAVNLTVLLGGGTASAFDFGEQKIKKVRHA